MTNPATDELVRRALKRADHLGDLLSDPPKPHPDGALIRELANALKAAEARTAPVDLEAMVERATEVIQEAYWSKDTGRSIKDAMRAAILSILPDEGDGVEIAITGGRILEDGRKQASFLWPAELGKLMVGYGVKYMLSPLPAAPLKEPDHD